VEVRPNSQQFTEVDIELMLVDNWLTKASQLIDSRDMYTKFVNVN